MAKKEPDWPSDGDPWQQDPETRPAWVSNEESNVLNQIDWLPDLQSGAREDRSGEAPTLDGTGASPDSKSQNGLRSGAERLQAKWTGTTGLPSISHNDGRFVQEDPSDQDPTLAGTAASPDSKSRNGVPSSVEWPRAKWTSNADPSFISHNDGRSVQESLPDEGPTLDDTGAAPDSTSRNGHRSGVEWPRAKWTNVDPPFISHNDGRSVQEGLPDESRTLDGTGADSKPQNGHRSGIEWPRAKWTSNADSSSISHKNGGSVQEDLSDAVSTFDGTDVSPDSKPRFQTLALEREEIKNSLLLEDQAMLQIRLENTKLRRENTRMKWELEIPTAGNGTKSKVVLAFIEAVGVAAFFGLDRCYMGQTIMGVVKGVTLGGFGVWAIVDYVVVAINIFRKEEKISVLGFQGEFYTDNDALQMAVWILVAGMVFKCSVCCWSILFRRPS